MHKRNFDLDLAYITRRIIAMGYPATGCESFYRNSFSEVKQFLTEEHGDKYKIYNLCMEKSRIYKKTAFGGPGVSLFPFKDHQSCPVKLMLEFCIDVCIFLLKDDENVAAIHCKAGKGRTGTMICAYLLFTEVALNSVNAFEMYGTRRSKEKKGVPGIGHYKLGLKYPKNFYIEEKVERFHTIETDKPGVGEYDINDAELKLKKKDATISAVKSVRKDPFEVSKDTKNVPGIGTYNINKRDIKGIYIEGKKQRFETSYNGRPGVGEYDINAAELKLKKKQEYQQINQKEKTHLKLEKKERMFLELEHIILLIQIVANFT